MVMHTYYTTFRCHCHSPEFDTPSQIVWICRRTDPRCCRTRKRLASICSAGWRRQVHAGTAAAWTPRSRWRRRRWPVPRPAPRGPRRRRPSAAGASAAARSRPGRSAWPAGRRGCGWRRRRRRRSSRWSRQRGRRHRETLPNRLHSRTPRHKTHSDLAKLRGKRKWQRQYHHQRQRQMSCSFRNCRICRLGELMQQLEAIVDRQ